jgi:predicted metal-dependent hydrolase
MIAEKLPPKASTGAKWQDADELRWAARHWAVRIGVKVPHIHIRPMTTKWASISTAGRLTLDAGLVNLPKELGEFVIVHELVHMLAPNHGKLFKSFMYAYMPDWAEREQQLNRCSRIGNRLPKHEEA